MMYIARIGESLNQIPLCDYPKPRTTSNTPTGCFISGNQTLTAIRVRKVEHIKEKGGEDPFKESDGRTFPLKWRSSTLNKMNRGKAPFIHEIQTLREIRGPRIERSIKTKIMRPAIRLRAHAPSRPAQPYYVIMYTSITDNDNVNDIRRHT